MSYDGGAQFYGFLFYDLANPDKYAFGDVRVRKALQLGIDSKEIATKMLGGYGGPYYLFGIDEFGYYADPNVMKPDPYDPEGAKKLLAEAGYANGFTTKIYDVGKGGLSSQMALVVSGYWRKMGVNAELVPMELVRVQQLYRPKHLPDIWNTLECLWRRVLAGQTTAALTSIWEDVFPLLRLCAPPCYTCNELMTGQGKRLSKGGSTGSRPVTDRSAIEWQTRDNCVEEVRRGADDQD